MRMIQTGLFGFEVVPVEKKKKYKKKNIKHSEVPEDCCPQCFYAKEHKCTCRCGGRYHGVGAGLQKLDRFNGDTVLSESQAQPFKNQIQITSCRWCGADLSEEPIRAYPHSAGWTVLGFEEPQWLYIVCPRCGYQWALWKLGFPRS